MYEREYRIDFFQPQYMTILNNNISFKNLN